MPRTAAANERRRATRRAKILASAGQVFAVKGTAATMADIAAAAGVSQGLAYRYFASKEALLHELVEQVLASSSTIIPQLREMPGTPGQRLDALVARIVEGRRAYPSFFQLFYQALADEALPATLRDRIGERGQLLRDTLRRLIVEGQATGEVAPDDPDQLVAAVLICLDGLGRGVAAPELAWVNLAEHFPDTGIILRLLKPAADQSPRPPPARSHHAGTAEPGRKDTTDA